jgi:hypothetical protein
LRQALRRSASHQCISAWPILADDVAIEQRRTKDILRARIAAFGGLPDPGHRPGAVAVLEEDQAEIGLGLFVALLGRLFIPGLGKAKIARHAPAKLIGLAHVELCIGIALFSERAPLPDGVLEIAGLPRLDACLDVSSGGLGRDQGKRSPRCHRHPTPETLHVLSPLEY